MAAVPSTGRASEVERGAAAPEADATRTLYERYAGQIYGFCLHRLGSREEAEDAVQTVFLNAFRGLRRGVVPGAESAWLFKIAENVCLTRHRSAWRRGRVESPSDMQALQDVTPARDAETGDDLIPLGDALTTMAESQRRAILLREWQGLSYREIAEEMGVSQSAVETLIFRARRSLANALETPRRERRTASQAGRRAFDLGSLLAGLKTLLAGGTAAKVAAVAAVAATGTAALAVAEGRHPATPARVRPSVAAARAPDSVVRRPVAAPVASAASPSVERTVAATLRPALKRQRGQAAAAKPKARPRGSVAPVTEQVSKTHPAAPPQSRRPETPPGQAKEPGTPANPKGRAARPERQTKAKSDPKPANEPKPKPKTEEPRSEQPSPPPPPATAGPPPEDKAKEKGKGE